MALKQAQIFKDFYIAANADNTGVTFSMNAPLTVSVKNDNFAQQVQILDNADTTDLFDYKYITFDGHAVFEITDCIKNDKYTTLFVQYLSNIKFDAVDSNFRVDAVSIKSLQLLGLDTSGLLAILGNGASIGIDEVDTQSNLQPTFAYAIKVRLSAIPDNANFIKSSTATAGFAESSTDILKRSRAKVVNQSYTFFNSGGGNISTASASCFDTAYTCLLPIPTKGTFVIVTSEGTTFYGMADFVSALTTIISDLTLSVEITMFNGATILQQIGSVTTVPTYLTNSDLSRSNDSFGNQTIWTLTLSNVRLNTYVRFLKNPNGTTLNRPAIPCPCIFMLTEDNEEGTFNSGLVECFNWLYLKVLELNDDVPQSRIYTSIELLGNTIDISRLRKTYLHLKRGDRKMRCYIDVSQNHYQDIMTDWEYIKSAFSNYEAYAKGNMYLVQWQQTAALDQRQQQARELQTVDTAFSAANTVTSTIKSAATGNYLGAASNLVGGAANIAQSEIKFNMHQQNDRANLGLSQYQERERARKTLVPSSERSGTISPTTYLTAIPAVSQNNNKIHSFFTRHYFNVTQNVLAVLERYIFESQVTDKYNAIYDLAKPDWQTRHNYFQVKIENNSIINNRKGLIIFAEVRS